MSQAKYIIEILQRANMIACRLVSTPMSTSEKLSKEVGTMLSASEAMKYKSVVGALQYLTITHPGISFAVNKVCQYLRTLTDSHWAAVKHILRYLKFSQKMGLGVQRSDSLLLSAFIDADWESCVDDRRSKEALPFSLDPT